MEGHKYIGKNIFIINLFDRIVRRFFDHTFYPKPPVLTARKKIIYFCLPFTEIHSLQIYTEISRLCDAAFPHLDIRFVFRSSRRISSFFPFTDKVPKYLRFSVVYLFKCRCCSASYMWIKPRAIYTLGYENIWISLQTQENTLPTLLLLVFSPIQTPLAPS